MSWQENTFFTESMKEVIRWEGGYVDHPNDPGGATNFGISLRFYRENIDATADKKDIQSLTKNEAMKIYYNHFWLKGGYDQYDFTVAKRLFGFAVNMGIKRANKLLQRAIMAAGGDWLEVDGVIGEKTLKELSCVRPEIVAACLRSEAYGRYRYLVAVNPKLKPFLNGWMRRAYT